MSNPLIEPKQFPTTMDAAEMERITMNGAVGIHESLFRSAMLLRLVKDLLNKKVDHEVILQIIELNYSE